MTVRDVFIRFGYDLDKASEKKAESSINGLKSLAIKALGAIGITLGLNNVRETADEFVSLRGRIDLMNDGLSTTDETMQAIYEAANRSRGSYAATADMVAKLGMMAKDAFGSNKEIIDFSETVNKMFVVGGASADDAQNAIRQLSQAMAAGALRGDELMSIMENAPVLSDSIAKSMGVTIGEMREMAGEGKVTVDVIKKAVTDSADEMEAAFKKMPMTTAQAMGVVQNMYARTVDKINQKFKVTDKLAKGIVRTGELLEKGINKVLGAVDKVQRRVGGLNNLLKITAAIAGTLFVMTKYTMILGALGKIVSLLKAINLQLLKSMLHFAKMFLAIMLVFLLIEDFIGFMKGNDSLIGEMLKKAGVDADALRDKINKFWADLKEKVIPVLKDLKDSALATFKAIGGWWEQHGSAMLEGISKVFVGILEAIAGIFSGDLSKVFSGFGKIVNGEFNMMKQGPAGFIIALLAIVPAFKIFRTALSPILKLLSNSIYLFKNQRLVGLAMQGNYKALGNTVKGLSNAFKGLAGKLLAPGKAMLQASKSIAGFVQKLNAVGKIKNVFGGFNPGTLTSGIKTLAKVLGSNLVKGINVVIAAFRVLGIAMMANPIGFIIGLIMALVSAFLYLWNTNEGFRNFFINAWATIRDFFISAWEAIKSKAQEAWNFVKQRFQEGVLAVQTALQTAKDFIATTWEAIKTVFQTAISAIVGFFQPLIDKLAAVSGAVEKVKGALQGIGDKVNSGISFAKGLAGFAGGTNNTPESFVAGEEGPELITGAKGRKVFTAAETGNVFNTLASIARLGTKPSTESMGTTTAIAQSRSIVQNIQISNTFNGDKAGQQKSAVAMDKASGDITGALSRGLQFAR